MLGFEANSEFEGSDLRCSASPHARRVRMKRVEEQDLVGLVDVAEESDRGQDEQRHEEASPAERHGLARLLWRLLFGPARRALRRRAPLLEYKYNF